MALTKFRLEQLSGSFDELENEARQYLGPSTAITLTGSDVFDLLGGLGGAIHRMHGKGGEGASFALFNNAASTLADQGGTNRVTYVDGASTILLGPGGSAEVTVADASTTLGGNLVIPDAGTIGNATTAGAITLVATGAAVFSNNIRLPNNGFLGSAGQAEAIKIASDGIVTFADDILIKDGGTIGNASVADAMTVAGTGIVTFKDDILIKDGGTIGNATTAGAITLVASGAAVFSDNIRVKNNGFLGSAGQAEAIKIASDGIVTFVDDIKIKDAGTIGNASAADVLTLAASGIVTFKDDILLKNDATIGTAGTADAILIDSDGDVTLKRDVDITRDLTVGGDFIVQGSTTTVSSSNLVVQDSIIGLGVSGSTNPGDDINNLGDRGIIFARAANAAQGPALPGFFWDGDDFTLAATLTSPLSQSFGAVSEFNDLKLGLLKLADTNSTHHLAVDWSEDDTGDRTLDIKVAGGDRTLTFNEGFTIGDGHVGTLTFSAASKTLTVEDTSVINQDVTTDASPQFAQVRIDSANDHLDVAGGTFTATANGAFKVDAAQHIFLDSDAGLVLFQDDSVVRGAMSFADTNSFTLASLATMNLSSSAGVVQYMDDGVSYLKVINNSGDAVLSASVHNKDIKFNANNGVEAFRIDGGLASALIPGTGKLLFNDDGTFIQSSTDGLLDIVSDGQVMVTGSGIQLDTGPGTVQLRRDASTYLEFIKTGDGAVLSSSVHNSDIVLNGNNGAEVFRVDSSVNALQVATAQKLQFRDTGIFAQSPSDGHLNISADGDGANVMALALTSSSGMAFFVGDRNDTFKFNNGGIEVGRLTAAPSTTANKVYNHDGTLFWDGRPLLSASVAARVKAVGVVSASLAALKPISFTGFDFSENDSENLVDIYVNGQLMRSGANQDYLAGSGSSAATMEFNFALEADDVITYIKFPL
jgi:hypothetical protein